MTGGGLIQLAITGIQDAPLTLNPEITFFKKVYKQHTPFTIYQNNRYLGRLDFNKESNCIISQNGDLLYNQYLKLDIPHFTIDSKTNIINTINNININSIEIYNNDTLCYIYYINNQYYVIDNKLFLMIDINHELYNIDKNILTNNVLPDYIKFTSNCYLYKLIDNPTSSLINILLYKSNLLENICLNESLNNKAFYDTITSVKSKYNVLYNKLKNEIFINYPNKFYFNYDFNFAVNEVSRYFEDLSINNLGYDMDIAYQYCKNNFLNFNNYKDNILPYNLLVLSLIFNFLYADHNLIMTIWKKYEISNNNVININNISESYNFTYDWEQKLNYYSNTIFKINNINNPLFENFKRNYILIGKNIVSIIENMNLSNPTHIYIKLKTILSRFYNVPNLQLNFNNYYYGTFYNNANLIDLLNNDNYNYQLNYETTKYTTLISNQENLSSNEMNNLTPVNIEYVFALISYDVVDNLITLYNLNKSIKSFIIFWRNNVLVRLYKKFLDVNSLNSNNGGLLGYQNRKSTFYYSLYPTNLYLVDDFKKSYYELFFKESWMGYMSINNNNFINLKNNIFDVHINLTDVVNLDTTINISNNSINLNKNFNKLSIQNNYNYIYSNNKIVYSVNNLLYIKFNNYYNDNCIIKLTINNKIINYNKIYYNNQLYLIIECNNKLVLNNEDIINLNIIFNEELPIVLFHKDKINYPIINTNKYYLYTQSFNSINDIDITLLNEPTLKLLNIVYYNKINKPLQFDLDTIYDTNNLIGLYEYCITFYTINDESDCSIIINIDVPANKVVKIYNIPISSNPNVIGRKIYRTKNNNNKFYLLTTITNNTETIYIDKINDDKLGLLFNNIFTLLPNSNTKISTTIVNTILENNKIVLYDMNNDKITFHNLDNIYEIYIEDFKLNYSISNNLTINNNIVSISDTFDKNSLYYLVNKYNYKDNIKLIPSQPNIPYKSLPFTLLTQSGNVDFPIIWEFAQNGYYYNTINNIYYIINENGIINIINFININPSYTLTSIYEYEIYNNNLYNYGNLVTEGYYKYDNHKVIINISNTIKKYNEKTAIYYSSIPTIVINNSYIIFNNKLYYGNNNTWNIINKGYYYVNNKYIYIKNSDILSFNNINATFYNILPLIGINNSYVIYNGNLYFGNLNKWDLVIQGGYYIKSDNNTFYNTKNSIININNSLKLFNYINAKVVYELSSSDNYVMYNNKLYYNSNNAWVNITNNYFFVVSDSDIYNNKYIYCDNNGDLIIFNIINASYSDTTPDNGLEGQYIIVNNVIKYYINSAWATIKSNNFLIFSTNILYNYKLITVDINGIISFFNKINVLINNILPDIVSNNTYTLVNNQLYYGNNNQWNLISNGFYFITSIIVSINNVYLYINNGNAITFSYIIANNYDNIPETTNIGEYIIYNNNIYLGTERYWELLIKGNYIISSDNINYNNKFTIINITNSLQLFNSIIATTITDFNNINNNSYYIYNNQLYLGNNIIDNDYYYISNLDRTYIIDNQSNMLYFINITNYKIDNNNLYFNNQLVQSGYYFFNDIFHYIDLSEGSLIDINFNNISAINYDIIPITDIKNGDYIINNNILYIATTKLVGTFKYKISFYNTETFNESYPSDEISITNNDINKYIEISNFSPIYDNTYNAWKIYRTTNNSNKFYFIKIIKNNSYIDNNPNSIIVKTPYILPFFYLSTPTNNSINYNILKIPINNFVPNLNDFISHSTDCDFINNKNLSDLNDYIFNKSFIMIASNKLILNHSTLYFYNIKFKLNETSKITLNDIDITFLLPLSTQQFFIKPSDEKYYDLNLNSIDNSLITQTTFNPAFDYFNIPPSELINKYASDYINILSDKIDHIIDNDNSYKVIINTIESINNLYLELFNKTFNSLNKYCGTTTLKIFNDINIKFSNSDFNKYCHESLRLLKDNNISQDKLTFSNLINLLSPVYNYYNANKIISNTNLYLNNISLYFTNHIQYIKDNETYLDISNPNNYQEEYLSNDEIDNMITNSFYNNDETYNITLLHPIDNNNIYKIIYNNNTITNFKLNNNIIITSSFDNTYTDNKLYDKIMINDSHKMKYIGLFSNISNYYYTNKYFKFDDSNIYKIDANNNINDINYLVIHSPYEITLPNDFNILSLIKIPSTFIYKIKVMFNEFINITISNLTLNDISINNIYIIDNNKLYIGNNGWTLVNGFYNFNNNNYKIVDGYMISITLSSGDYVFSINNKLINGTLSYNNNICYLYFVIENKINLYESTLYYLNNNVWNMIPNISHYDIEICKSVNYKIDYIINNSYYEINNKILYYDSFSVINNKSYIYIDSLLSSIIIKSYNDVVLTLYPPMVIKNHVVYSYDNNLLLNYDKNNYVLLINNYNKYFIKIKDINIIPHNNYHCWVYNSDLPRIYIDIDVIINNNELTFNDILPNYCFYQCNNIIYYYETGNVMYSIDINIINNISFKGIYLIDNDIFDTDVRQMLKVSKKCYITENYVDNTISYNDNIFKDTLVNYNSYYTLESFDVYNKIISSTKDDVIVNLLFDNNIYYPIILTRTNNNIPIITVNDINTSFITINSDNFNTSFITINSDNFNYKLGKIITNDILISTTDNLILISIVDTQSRYYDVYINSEFTFKSSFDLFLWKIKCINSNNNIYYMYFWTLFSNNNNLLTLYSNVLLPNIAQPLYTISNIFNPNYKIISSSPNLINNNLTINELYYKYYIDIRDDNNYEYSIKTHNFNGILNIKPKLIYSPTITNNDKYIYIDTNYNIYYNNEFNLINNKPGQPSATYSGHYLDTYPIYINNKITINNNTIIKYDKTFLTMGEIIIINNNFYYVNGLNVSTQYYELKLLRGHQLLKDEYNGYYTIGIINKSDFNLPELELNNILSYNEDININYNVYYDSYIEKIVISNNNLELSHVCTFNNKSIKLNLFYNNNRLFYFDNFIKLQKFDIIIYNNTFYEIINIRDNEIITNPTFNNNINNVYISFILPYQPFINIFITDNTVIEDNSILLLQHYNNFKSIDIINSNIIINDKYSIIDNKLYIGKNDIWELVYDGYYNNNDNYFFVSQTVIINITFINLNNNNNDYVINDDKLYYNNIIAFGYYYIVSDNIKYNNNLIHVNNSGKINIITNNLYYDILINNDIKRYNNKWVRLLKYNINSFFENKYIVNDKIDYYSFPFEIKVEYVDNKFKILHELNHPQFYILQPVKLGGDYNYIKKIVRENNNIYIYLLNKINMIDKITFSTFNNIIYYFPLKCLYNNAISIDDNITNINVNKFILDNDKLIYETDVIFSYGTSINDNNLYFYNYHIINKNGYIDNYNLLYNSYHLLIDKNSCVYLIKITYPNKINFYSDIIITNDKYYIDNVFSVYINNDYTFILSLDEIHMNKEIHYNHSPIKIIYKYDINMINDLIYSDNIYKQEIKFNHDKITGKVYIDEELKISCNVIKINNKYYITSSDYISNNILSLYTETINYIQTAIKNITTPKVNEIINDKYEYIVCPIKLYNISNRDYYYNIQNIILSENYYINEIGLSIYDINNQIITLNYDTTFKTELVNLLIIRNKSGVLYNNNLYDIKELRQKLFYVKIDLKYLLNYVKPWDKWTMYSVKTDLIYKIYLKWDNGNIVKIDSDIYYLSNYDINKLTIFLTEINTNNILKNNYYKMKEIEILIFDEIKTWLKHPDFFMNCIDNINDFLKYNSYDAFFDGNNIIFNNDLHPNYYDNSPSYYITNEYVYEPTQNIVMFSTSVNYEINSWINKTNNSFIGVSVNKLLKYLVYLGNNYNDILNKKPINNYDINTGLKVLINELFDKYDMGDLNPNTLDKLDIINNKIITNDIFPYKISLYNNNIIPGSTWYIDFIDGGIRDNKLITPVIYPNQLTFYYSSNNLDYLSIIQSYPYKIILNTFMGYIHYLQFDNINNLYIDKIYYKDYLYIINISDNITVGIQSNNILNDTLFELIKYMSIKTFNIINNRLYLKFYNMNFNYIANSTFININNQVILLNYDDNGYYIDKILTITNRDVIIINKVIPIITYTNRVIYYHKLDNNIDYKSNDFNEFVIYSDINYNPISINILDDNTLIGIYDDNLANYNFTKIYHNQKLNHLNTNKILGITFLNEYLYEINDNINLAILSDIFIYDNDIDIINSIYEPDDINKKSLYIINKTSFVLSKLYDVKDIHYIIKNKWVFSSYYYTDTNIIITIPSDMIINKDNYYYKINDYVIDKDTFIINSQKLIINWEYEKITGDITFYQYYIEPSDKITSLIIPKLNKKYNINYKNNYQYTHNNFYILPYTYNGVEFKKYLYKIKTLITTNLNGYQPTNNIKLDLIYNNTIYNGIVFLTYHDDYIYYITSFNDIIDINKNYYFILNNINYDVNSISYYQESLQFAQFYNQSSLNNVSVFAEDINNYNIIDNEYNNFYLISYDKYDITNFINIKQSDNMKIKTTTTINNVYNSVLPDFISYNKIFKYIKLYFNNQLIDEINEDIFNIHYYLYLSSSQKKQFNNITKIRKTQYGWTVYIPLIYWYSLDPGLALPTIAMKNTEIKLVYKLNEIKDIVSNDLSGKTFSNNIPHIKISLISDCILLDMEERKLFGTFNHEYIISRYQPITFNYLNDKQIVMNKKLSGLVKDITFITKPLNTNTTFIPEYIKNYDSRFSRYNTSYDYYLLYINNNKIYTNETQKEYALDISIIENNIKEFNDKSARIDRLIKTFGKMSIWDDNLLKYLMYYEDKYLGKTLSDIRKNYIMMIYLKYQYKNEIIVNEISPINSIMIEVNGERLFNAMDESYFNNIIPTQKYNNSIPTGYYCHTFSLNPLEKQFTGHLNFTNFDDVSITITSDNILPCNIYTVVKEYNIIRIMSNMAELAWIN